MKTEKELRAELVWACRRMDALRLVAATDGNVSCRLSEDTLLVTPSGVPKGELEEPDFLLVDMNGELLVGVGKPSSEIMMHLLVYEKRPEVGAVVHAHPPVLTAFTLAGFQFIAAALPEVWITIGPVPTAPYATPSTEEVPRSIAPFVERHNAILLERHGSITMGLDIRQAFQRLEKLEHAAHTLYTAHMLDRNCPTALPRSLLGKLESLPFARLQRQQD